MTEHKRERLLCMQMTPNYRGISERLMFLEIFISLSQDFFCTLLKWVYCRQNLTKIVSALPLPAACAFYKIQISIWQVLQMLRIWCQTYFILNLFSTQLTVYRPTIVSEEVIKGRNVWVSKDVWDTLGDYLSISSWSLASLHGRTSSSLGSLWRFWNVRGEPLEY